MESIIWVHKLSLTETDKIIYSTKDEQEKALKELANKTPRLFSGSANGLIIEWDTTKLKSKVNNINNIRKKKFFFNFTKKCIELKIDLLLRRGFTSFTLLNTYLYTIN